MLLCYLVIIEVLLCYCLFIREMPFCILWIVNGYCVFVCLVGFFKLRKTRKFHIFIFYAMAILISFLCLILAQNVLSRKKGAENTGISNLVRIRKALDKYMDESGGIYPSAETWCDDLLKADDDLSRKNFIIPRIQKNDCDFVYNKNIEGLSINDVPEDMVVIFMSEGKWNLSGGEELLKKRDMVLTYVLLSDGAIEWCRFPERDIRGYNENTNEIYRVQLRWKAGRN